MPCNNLRGQLSLYAGRDLDTAHAMIVGQHVDHCPSCDSTVSKYGQTVSLLGDYGRLLESRPVPRSLLGGIVDRLSRAPFPKRDRF